MKKSLLPRCYNLFALLFLAVVAPIFFSSEANAACQWTVNATTGVGTCAVIPGTQDTVPACSTYTNNQSCSSASVQITANANDNAFVSTMCSALKIVTGNGGKAFAAFAIISLGIGFFTGKVSWGLMIGVAAGIAAMFGAPTIVAAISGGTAFNCGA